MFCFQCQETAQNTGCTVKGVCGKPFIILNKISLCGGEPIDIKTWKSDTATISFHASFIGGWI
jgi:hypothetical protein